MTMLSRLKARHWCWAVLLGLVGAAFTPLGALVYLGAPVATLVVGGVLVWRRDFVAAVEVSLWCWMLAPFVRRVVELQVGYQAQNVVLLAPVTIAVPLGVALLFVRRALPRGVLLGVAGVVGSMVVGTALGLAQLPVVAAVVGVTSWVPPLVVGLAVLLLPMPRDALVLMVGRVGVWGSVVVGGYGVVQWLLVPVWDSTWLVAVSPVTIALGLPFPQEIRVFSTMNSPGPAASALLFCVVMASLARQFSLPWRAVAVALGLAGLGLTEVRQVYLAGLLFVGIALVKRLYLVRTVLVLAACLVAVVVLVPAAQDSVGSRVVSSAQAGGSDESLNERVEFQRVQFAGVLVRPVGLGLGSTGSGVRASDQSGTFGNTDSGYLEIFRTFGPIAGAVLLMSIVAMARTCGSLTSSPAELGLYCLVLTIPVQLAFGNILTGSSGVFAWFALMCAVRLRFDLERKVPVRRPGHALAEART